MKYRPEIDGLRTIAVLSVMIYHADFPYGTGSLLRGGYLGVDLFFVISGYLITSLIMIEHHETGRLRILDFYERRARRLLPALLVVILASFPVAWLYLLPNQIVDYSNSVITSIFFGSNFYWYASLQEYGADSALLKPFLHTWTLAVEGQYYVLFPLLLLGIYKWFKRHALVLLSTGLMLSLIFADLATQQDASFSFYMLPSRFWEFLAGGLLANFLYLHPRQQHNSLLSHTMPILGLYLIVHSVIFFELSANHPGYITLIPVMGTVLIIWFTGENDVVTRLLSSRLFVVIGLISYSMYLWHYPIFAFARILEDTPSTQQKIVWILLTTALSAVTYLLIEKPVRSRHRVSTRGLVLAVGTLTSIAILANSSVLWSDGSPSRMPRIISNIETNVMKVRICEKGKTSCTINPNQDARIFLIGDSHMMSLEEPLQRFAFENGFSLTAMNVPGCLYILNLNRVMKGTQKPQRYCNTKLQEIRRKTLLAAKPSTIIVGGRLPMELAEERFDNGEGGYEGRVRGYLQSPDNSLHNRAKRNDAIFREYRKSLLELAEHGHRVVLIYPIPEVGWHVPRRIQKRFNRYPYSIAAVLSEKPITTSYEVFKERTKSSFALLDGVQHENIVRIYPHELFCGTAMKDRCVTHNLVDSFYRDDNHLSDVGSEMLHSVIEAKLRRMNHW